jgi:hypothetical protein
MDPLSLGLVFLALLFTIGAMFRGRRDIGSDKNYFDAQMLYGPHSKNLYGHHERNLFPDETGELERLHDEEKRAG